MTPNHMKDQACSETQILLQFIPGKLFPANHYAGIIHQLAAVDNIPVWTQRVWSHVCFQQI